MNSPDESIPDFAESPEKLNFRRCDPETRCHLPSGVYTNGSAASGILLGLLLTLLLYAVLLALRNGQLNSPWIEMFFHGGSAQRGILAYLIVFLSMWCLALLLLKFLKLRGQRQALAYLPPTAQRQSLSIEEIPAVLQQIGSEVVGYPRFVLINRLVRSLELLRNLKRPAELQDFLAFQEESDEKVFSSGYTLIRGLLWAIPVAGFIGTVFGLARSVGGFGSVIEQSGDLNAIKAALSTVTGGLAIAFETTLMALVAALLLQLLLSLIEKAEEDFLSDCREYCRNYLLGRLRDADWQDELR